MASGMVPLAFFVADAKFPPDVPKVVPLTCHGHSRPVPHISFSSIVEDDQYYLISACKGAFFQIAMTSRHAHKSLDNNPMLRDGITGDW
jgi:serine-threonine kinase receptor-associated protein